jgi:hypothetical protein
MGMSHDSKRIAGGPGGGRTKPASDREISGGERPTQGSNNSMASSVYQVSLLA